MSFLVSSFPDVAYVQNKIVDSVRVDDYTAEWAIIVSNEFYCLSQLIQFRLHHVPLFSFNLSNFKQGRKIRPSIFFYLHCITALVDELHTVAYSFLDNIPMYWF